MFGTVLSYVTLRLLGVEASHPTAAAARAWMLAHGGATAVPSWGKFWLATLGVYEWCVAVTQQPSIAPAMSLTIAH
jgi:squalene cyclase